MGNNKNKPFKRFDLAEGFEFVVDQNFDPKNLTPEQKSKLECVCKNSSYDYLALSSFISTIVNNYANTLDDIDIIVAILSSVINDLLLLRIIRATCEKNVTNSMQGLEPASKLAPGLLFDDNQFPQITTSQPLTRTNTSNKSRKIRKIKKVKKKRNTKM